jgi:hypothetical protein
MPTGMKRKSVTKPRKIEARIQRLEDLQEILNLQERYHFYLGMYDIGKVVECFAQNHPEVSAQISDRGKFVGIGKIRQVFENMQRAFNTKPGFMGHVMGLNPVVEINPDGRTATGLWYGFGPHSLPAPVTEQVTPMWLCGKYEMDYIKEDNRWKFLHLRFFLIFRTPYDQGWVKESEAPRVDPNNLPDECSSRHMPYDVNRVNAFLPGPPEKVVV